MFLQPTQLNQSNQSNQFNQPEQFGSNLNSIGGFGNFDTNNINLNSNSNFGINNNYLNQNMANIGNMGNMGNMANMGGSDLINYANNIEPSSLNGTNLDDMVVPIQKVYKQRNKNEDNSSLIKSLSKEIINNLKENNLSLYDNTSLNSRKSENNENDDDNDMDSKHSKSSKQSKSKSRASKIVDKIEDFVVKDNDVLNELKQDDEDGGYINWFFDDCFNYKDFLVLFILYFVLSQEMIKDFFSKYFSCLNPDDEGKVGVQGVIIYGLVLTILFMCIRKFF